MLERVNNFYFLCRKENAPKKPSSPKYQDPQSDPTLPPKSHTFKLNIPPTDIFTLLFNQNSQSTEIQPLPFKITISNAIDDLKFFSNFSNNSSQNQAFFEFSSKIDENYILQVIPAKSGSNRTRISVSNTSLLIFVLENSKNLKIEGAEKNNSNLPVDYVIVNYKKLIKLQKKFEKFHGKVGKIKEKVEKLQLDLIKFCKDDASFTAGESDDDPLEQKFQQIDKEILNMSDHIELLEFQKLQIQKASYDLYASFWLLEYMTSSGQPNSTILPQQPFEKLKSWNKFLENLFFDEEDVDESGEDINSAVLVDFGWWDRMYINKK